MTWGQSRHVIIFGTNLLGHVSGEVWKLGWSPGFIFSCFLGNLTSLHISRDSSSLFDKSTIADRKEPLPPLPETDSPPLSPRKRVRPIKTVESFDSQEGRSVGELRVLIKRTLQENYPAFEEVRSPSVSLLSFSHPTYLFSVTESLYSPYFAVFTKAIIIIIIFIYLYSAISNELPNSALQTFKNGCLTRKWLTII